MKASTGAPSRVSRPTHHFSPEAPTYPGGCRIRGVCLCGPFVNTVETHCCSCLIKGNTKPTVGVQGREMRELEAG